MSGYNFFEDQVFRRCQNVESECDVVILYVSRQYWSNYLLDLMLN